MKKTIKNSRNVIITIIVIKFLEILIVPDTCLMSLIQRSNWRQTEKLNYVSFTDDVLQNNKLSQLTELQ